MLRYLPLCLLLLLACNTEEQPKLQLHQGARIALLGNNLCSRMMNYGSFETELHLAFPDSNLWIRNICDGGNTPAFRPHPGRKDQWAFENGRRFHPEMADDTLGVGDFESDDGWLNRLQADIILAFFGYNAAFSEPFNADAYHAELEAFINHSLSQQYNDDGPSQLALISPTAFETIDSPYDLPTGEKENQNLTKITEVMRSLAAQYELPFVDAFKPSKSWMEGSANLTIDGLQLNEVGYAHLANLLVDQLFTNGQQSSATPAAVQTLVQDKNWYWHNDFKIPNGVHVYGQRYDPFGPDNYPFELAKIRALTANRDTAIWRLMQEQTYDLTAADALTPSLPEVITNYETADGDQSPAYLYGQEAMDKFHLADGYELNLFASEREFPDLANPVQISFDNQGRLWVAVMPSYPHYRPGDNRPNDKLIILEDTDGDGRADQQKTFADSLHLPIGFELSAEGVYISQGTNLMLLTDTDGDDQADQREILLSGFDDHDTHHAISAFCADPSGAIYMAEGIFLHTNVETPYGPVRGSWGGFFRYNPQRRQLENTAQISIPNPWGIAFDNWGQPFYAETSSPNVRWMTPSTISPRYGVFAPLAPQLIEKDHMVRPTSGIEFLHSSHFPEEVQGDLLINNTIGYLGTKQHRVWDDTTGYQSAHRQDLIWSDDPNYRPVDLEIAPDGSLYIADWHNVLIGHMQHNARDPLRDHAHGRIYRISYPARPLIEPAQIAGASLGQLFDNLKLPEYRSRYRTRRELRGRKPAEVLNFLTTWIDELDPNEANYEHHLLEGLWVSWGANQINPDLLQRCLFGEDDRLRAAATMVLRYSGHQINDQVDFMMAAASDPHPRVRLSAVVAASWLNDDEGRQTISLANQLPKQSWVEDFYRASMAHVSGQDFVRNADVQVPEHLTSSVDQEAYKLGREIYEREGFCGTCHQADGLGLRAAEYPPLAGTRWANGNEERLIKLTLHGLIGPIEVQGKTYPGQVPMTPYRGLLNDEEVAAVLTYVRNNFGNQAAPVTAESVARVRASTLDQDGFYHAEELLQQYPFPESTQQ